MKKKLNLKAISITSFKTEAKQSQAMRGGGSVMVECTPNCTVTDNGSRWPDICIGGITLPGEPGCF